MFINGDIVIFGGTGTIGTVFTEVIMEHFPDLDIYLATNNEHEIWEAKNKYNKNKNVHILFADIRDRDETRKIFMNIKPKMIINCAALKHVDYCEDFVMNTIKTNIMGLENLLYLTNEYYIPYFIQVSTDKAVEPISVMGATKMLGEKLCREWNKLIDGVICIRLGNVIDSRGSLIPTIKKQLEHDSTVFYTDERMERYIITIDELKKFIRIVFEHAEGGEIFIPKLEEVNILKFIEEIVANEVPNAYTYIKFQKIGRRQGEKFKEKLYSEFEEVVEYADHWRAKL